MKNMTRLKPKLMEVVDVPRMERLYLCSICSRRARYSKEFDAYFCNDCGIWLDSKCGHDDCVYCNKRPDKPDTEMV